MAWTYGGDPADNERDAVRFLIGDKDDNRQLLSDEEIAWELEQRGDVHLAASSCCIAIAADFSRKVDRTWSTVSGSFSQQAEAYRKLAKDLLKEAGRAGVMEPYVGGAKVGDVESAREDDSRVQPRFRRGMFDDPVDIN